MSNVEPTPEKLNYVLTELSSNRGGCILLGLLKKRYPEVQENEAFLIQQKLAKEDFIALTDFSSDRKIAKINDKGREHILKGGYKSEAQKNIESTVKSMISRTSKIVQDMKTPKQNKVFFNQLNSVKTEVQYNIGVLSEEDLQSHLSKVKVLIRNHYGLMSNEASRIEKIVREGTRKDLMPLLIELITELEIKIGFTDLSNLHSEVRRISEEHFHNGHFREAVVNAFTLLIEITKNKYSINKDGLPLMQDVFSKENPKYRVSDDSNEQQGIMFLYSGAVAGIRNKYVHKTAKITNKQYALELLHFASFLFRLFDDSTIY